MCYWSGGIVVNFKFLKIFFMVNRLKTVTKTDKNQLLNR